MIIEKNESNNGLETQLQKCIRLSNSDYIAYEKLADYYNNTNRPSLALFCLTESLRIKPEQPRTFIKTIPLLKYSNPIKPVQLKESTCLVSVIMRTYNRLGEIRESIQSVLTQTIENYELIIINDHGLENIKNIVDSFSSDKIKYFRLSKNRGHAGAFNAGLLEASGKYIAYLDDDDIFYPDHLEKLTSFLEKNPTYDCAYSNTWWCYGELDGERFIEQKRELLAKRPTAFDKDLLLKSNYIPTLSLVYRKSCLHTVGLFNEDFRHGEDKEHLLRLALRCNFYQINDITGEYRWKSNNTSIDNTRMWFMGDLVFKYYYFNYLKIIQLKAALHYDQLENICEYFDEIMVNFNTFIQRYSNLKLLFDANQILATNNIRPLNYNILSEYFKHSSLNCIKSLILRRQFKAFLNLCPIILKKIF